MLSPIDSKIKNNLSKIKEMIMKDNVRLYFVPSAYLKSLIAKGEHPLVQNMPKNRKLELLEGGNVFIQKRLVWEWLNGKLDDKNSFILKNGDVRVIDTSFQSHDSLINKGNE